jgi:hypothetical protein
MYSYLGASVVRGLESHPAAHLCAVECGPKFKKCAAKIGLFAPVISRFRAAEIWNVAQGLKRLRKNSLDEGDGLQPVRLNVKMNRL